MFVGPDLSFASYSDVSYDSEIEYPELTDRNNLAFGIVYLWDTRNNLLNATEGRYVKIYAGYSFNGEENNPMLKTDLRAYKTWNNKYTLSTRWYTGLNFGTPTFYNYAIMGGDQLVRGYLYGRYRNNNLSTIQLESRAHLFWRIGLSIFGGYSYLFQDLKSTAAYDFKYNYGLGLRFLVDKKDNINLRLDYALGEDGQDGFYISFGESF
jgi:outer membrane protein assembly factor BamA